MSVNVGTAIAFLELDMSSFKNSLSAAGQDLSNFASGGGIQSLTSAMTNVGSTLTKSVTLPIVGIAAAATAASTDFEAQMSKVKAISGAVGEDFQSLRDQAIQLGADTNFSASEAANGMENLASAGFKTNEIISAMPGILSLAAAGDVSIANASDIAGSSLRGFGMEADKVNHVSDVMAKLAGDTNAGIMDTGEAMKYIAPVANAMGVSFEDASAAVGLLSNAGIKGGQAGTTLRTAMTNLAAPTKAANDVMAELGMSFFDAEGKMKPFGDVLQILKDKTAGLTQQQQASTMETLFGKEAMSGMIALVGQGPEKFNELSSALKNCDGAAKSMADTMQDNSKGAIEAMKGSLETAAIKIGDVLAPSIRSLAEWIGELVNKFSALPAPVQEFIVKSALVVAAIGPVLIILAKLIESVRTVMSVFSALKSAAGLFAALPGLIMSPVGAVIAIIAAIAAIVYVVIQNWDSLKVYFQAFFDFCKSLFESLYNFLKGIFDGIASIINSVVEVITSIINSISDFFKVGIEGIKEFFTDLVDFAKSVGSFIMEGLVEGLKKGWDKVFEICSDIVGGIKSIFTDDTDGLGIHSPSTVFDEYGKNTLQGYGQGLEKQQGNVFSRLGAITSKIKSIGNDTGLSSDFSGLGNVALAGAYSNNTGFTPQKSNQMTYSPNVVMHVTLSDTGGKGTTQLTNELKNMNQIAMKNSMVDNFMSDALRL